MGKIGKISSILMLIILTSNWAKSNLPNFFNKQQLSQAIEFSKKEHKPIILYIHSLHCSQSRKFTREVIGTEEIVSALKDKYICIDAEISCVSGNSIAKNFGVYQLPTVILYNPLYELKFELPLKIETQYITDHLRYFMSTSSIMEQIDLLKKTSGVTKTVAMQKIAVSYAKHDKKLSAGALAEYYIYGYTLDLPEFSDFSDAYKEEWNKSVMVEENNKIAITTKPQTP